ncbi:MAG: hypothetical protein HXS52_06765 [Theionarchaea archaeon]|nr:hypothetical protein [Theionarchaea archaeon]MBU7037616.1 hypothetical protein [Theionarchaea archaeon]
MVEPDASAYLETALPHMRRLLGLQDRTPSSSTYGCFDRSFWHYRVLDFANGRQQEAALTLALAYHISHPLNPYFGKEKIKQWSLAALQFLATIQNGDGSFDEYYPHEHAFVTTAFAAFAGSEGLLLLNERPSCTVEMLTRCGKFLLRRDELEVVNQNLGAAAALYNIYLLTDDEQFRKGAYAKLGTSLERQSPEGWFYEYGGPDIGYLSVAVSYLAHFYRKTKDGQALASLKKAVTFLSHFIHPDGTAGGEYGSRNTSYLVPDGIEICAQIDPCASYLAREVRTSLARKGFSPSDLDNRYLCNMLYNYLQAYRMCNPIKEYKLPEPVFYKESGLLMEKSDQYHLVANLHKGGVFKVFCNNELVASDCGILGRLVDGTLVTSQWLGTSFTRKKSGQGVQYTVTGQLVKVPEQHMTPLKILVLRSSLLIGQKYVSDVVKQLLRKQLITKKNTVPIFFERQLTLNKGIHITDRLRGTGEFAILHLVTNASLIYIPSSRYFRISELATPLYLTDDLSNLFNTKRELVLERNITCGTWQSPQHNPPGAH